MREVVYENLLGANITSPLKFFFFVGGSYVGAHFSFHLSQRSYVILPVCTMTFGMIGLLEKKHTSVCGEMGSHVYIKESASLRLIGMRIMF